MQSNNLLRENFSTFIEKVFGTVDPSSDYLANWHIELLADKLEQAAQGKIRRLIINIPPRSLKSIVVSVAWPAWLLGCNPSAKIMAASYSRTLSLKHSQDCRLVLSSNWYREIFPQTLIAKGENEKSKFVTTERGFRFATSVGGTATGEGADFLIVDDPHNAMQAASDVRRQNAIDWFDQAFMTRLNNKKTGVIVVVMQRLHVDDLAGHLLAKSSQWELLSLPAIAPAKKTYHYYNMEKTVEEGELLHEARENAEDIARIKGDLGSHGFACQYQQNPLPLEGGMVNLSWFRRYDAPPENGRVVQSWDTAVKAADGNDYTVCTTWREGENGYYLLDVMQRKMEYPDLKRTVVSLAERCLPDAILIEDKASGQSLLQDLRRETKLPVLAVGVVRDKVQRFSAVTALIEGGRVFLPKHAPWLPDYEQEILGFPNVPHDDMVDSTSQFLNWMRAKRVSEVGVRVL